MAPAATPETRIARAAAPLIAAGHPTGPARSGMLLGVLALAAPERAAVRAGCRGARRGGTAVGAAPAAAAALAVTLPNQCGLGGDLLAVVRRPDGGMVAGDGAGTGAPRVGRGGPRPGGWGGRGDAGPRARHGHGPRRGRRLGRPARRGRGAPVAGGLRIPERSPGQRPA